MAFSVLRILVDIGIKIVVIVMYQREDKSWEEYQGQM